MADDIFCNVKRRTMPLLIDRLFAMLCVPERLPGFLKSTVLDKGYPISRWKDDAIDLDTLTKGYEMSGVK